MVQWISPKSLLCRYEDLSSNSQYLCKKLGITMHACKSKCWGTRDRDRSLVSSCQLALSSVRDPSPMLYGEK